jgi:signal transduction histidine kinase
MPAPLIPILQPDGTPSAEPDRYWTRPNPLRLSARLVLLALVAGLAVFATRDAGILIWVALLLLCAVPGVLAAGHPVLGPLTRSAEVILVVMAASDAVTRGGYAHLGSAAFLPYLVVPVVGAALYRRRTEMAGLVGLAGVTMIIVSMGEKQFRQEFLLIGAQWLILSSLAGLVASLLQHTLLHGWDRPPPYSEATRLLTQLRSVARQLPGATLDPGGLAEHLLDEIREVAKADRAAVLSASGGGRLVVVAQVGAERVDWETALDSDSAIADAWATQQPQTAARSQTRSHPGGDVSALVVPLVAGVRTIGLVALEADTAGAYPARAVAEIGNLAAPAALRLEAALLFDEVRSLATIEERQRLAREIHDGVAQELVMVGYGIDNAMAVLPPDGSADAADELRALRAEVTRVITELRLSLFELRSEVDRHGGLGTAIAEYARQVGSSAGLRVHLSLDESTARLPAATEAELLRIGQEAITNARKHSYAENLWVTCAVDPPFAQVIVSDDGRGLQDSRPDGRYGLAIMAERAERIRGRLEITPRSPSGTTVSVAVGARPRRGSVAPPEGENNRNDHQPNGSGAH